MKAKRKNVSRRNVTALVATSAIAMMLLALVPALADPGSPQAYIAGTVKDMNNGLPLEGALVVLSYDDIVLSTITGEDGQYMFDDLPPSIEGASIKVDKDGYRSESEVVDHRNITVVDFELLLMELEPFKGTIMGTVTDNHDGRPLGKVHMELEHHGILRNTYTDSNGRYRFDHVPECYCGKEVTATLENFRPESIWVNVSGVTIVDFELWIEEIEPLTRIITGTVYDANTKDTIEGAQVKLSFTLLSYIVYTDTDGRYTFEGIPVAWEKVTLEVMMDGYQTVSRDIEFDNVNVVDFVLVPDENEPPQDKGTLKGMVVDGVTGEPIPGARVTVIFHGEELSTLTDDDGRYSVSGIPLCWCMKDLTASKVGYITFEQGVAIGEMTYMNMTLKSSTPDDGDVVDLPSVSDGNAGSGASGIQLAANTGIGLVLVLFLMVGMFLYISRSGDRF
jgi:protocatechuate 3,4-dioxygenase beta subunit